MEGLLSTSSSLVAEV